MNINAWDIFNMTGEILGKWVKYFGQDRSSWPSKLDVCNITIRYEMKRDSHKGCVKSSNEKPNRDFIRIRSVKKMTSAYF